MTLRPIEIVGGGLAGLALALALRRAAVPVTVWEAGVYPRHRVCGEFITGLDRATRDRLDLDPVLAPALRHETVAWCFAGQPIATHRLPEPALGVSRHHLDAALVERVIAAGGVVHAGTRLRDAAPREGRVFASGRRRGQGRWLGLKAHVRDLPLGGDLEVHLGRHAYVGLCRVEDGSINVCGLFRRLPEAPRSEARPPDWLIAYAAASGLAELAVRLRAATPVDGSFCSVAAVGFDRRVFDDDGALRIGDALAMIPPFTGHGMAMAFQSAAAVVDPLLDYARGESTWAGASAAARRALRARFQRRLGAAALVHPLLLNPRRHRWIRAAAAARLLPFGALYRLLHR